MKKWIAMLLAVMMVMSMTVAASAEGEEALPEAETQTEPALEGTEGEPMPTAEESEPVETVWNGDEIVREVTAGTDGYTWVSVYPGTAYEMSNHMVSADGGAHNSIPQTLVLVPAEEDYTWQADGLYEFNDSNYEVLYCCDEDTGYEDGVYYKRLNLEDSEYYDEEAAAHIRAIISNVYPYVTVEEMKQALAEEGFEGAEDLTRAELIAAIQMAVWNYANGASELAYSQTFDVTTNPQWGTVMHDYTNEMEVWWKTGKRKFSENEEVENRVNALAEHLKGYDAVYAEKNQIIISKIRVVDAAPVQEKAGVYKVAMQVELNNSGSSEDDEIYLTVSVDGTVVKSEKLTLGQEVYNFLVEAENGQNIEAVVSGKQFLPVGAYFYKPQGGREVSQSLVGVAGGETDVYAAASVTLEAETPAAGSLVLRKVDEKGNSLSGASFALYAKRGSALLYVGTYAVDGAGMLSVEDLLPGDYVLEETVVPEGYAAPEQDIEFRVSENGAVMLVAQSDLVYMADGALNVVNTNTQITAHTVRKVWNENNTGRRRPASVMVRLRQDGRNYGRPVMLNAANGWTYTWEDLPIGHTYEAYEVSVPSGWRASTVTEGEETVITNTAIPPVPTTTIPEEDPPMAERPPVPNTVDLDEGDIMTILDEDVPLAEAPKTGDMSSILMAAGSLAGAGLLITGRSKKKEESDDAQA